MLIKYVDHEKSIVMYFICTVSPQLGLFIIQIAYVCEIMPERNLRMSILLKFWYCQMIPFWMQLKCSLKMRPQSVLVPPLSAQTVQSDCFVSTFKWWSTWWQKYLVWCDHSGSVYQTGLDTWIPRRFPSNVWKTDQIIVVLNSHIQKN